MELKENSICRSQPVGRKKPGLANIVTSHKIESAIMHKKKVLKETGSDVKIQEDLTHR